MSNRLKGENSPYLLQHSTNPVDWYPWCEAAFERAKQEEKPVFLSIGYSTCHWCHVMAHESFENQETADILNKYFIAVKVDREERPDIDSVYMSVCQAFTGSGGWPASIFMTPEQKPFFAGTYFPPVSAYGMPGFRELLLLIARKWDRERDRLLESAESIVASLKKEKTDANGNINRQLPQQAVRLFRQSYDARNGGFGTAPKFPAAHNLIFLMLYAHINSKTEEFAMAAATLEKMRRGGIFDHIGYGFSRYSTDAYYLVPHFEKMLYDNALLIAAFAVAYKMSGDYMFLDTAEKTAAYILREMTGDEGEFYAAQDADSEGEEGKYYVWSREEICRILGEERGKQFCEYFGITEQGNFEGKNIPNLLNGNALSDSFEKETETLYYYRKTRAKLHLDDKILTSWNALMICAMCLLYRVCGRKEYLLAAQRAQQYIEEHFTSVDDGTLYVGGRGGKSTVKGFLDDYAFEAAALLSLYDVCGSSLYLQRAEDICLEAVRQFGDENGGFFLNGTKNGSLIARPKECYDGAAPGGNSVMAYCLVRLAQLTDRDVYKKAAEKQLAFMSVQAGDYPAGYSMFLTALLYETHPPEKITVVLKKGEDRHKLMAKLPLYADVRLLGEETEGYKLLNHETTYYVCREHSCQPPVNTLS